MQRISRLFAGILLALAVAVRSAPSATTNASAAAAALATGSSISTTASAATASAATASAATASAATATASASAPVSSTKDASSSASKADLEREMELIFSSLVQRTFGPQRQDHADIYYKTRFFTAHLQARMRYIIAQYDLENAAKDGSSLHESSTAASALPASASSSPSPTHAPSSIIQSLTKRSNKDSTSSLASSTAAVNMALTQAEADQLNEIMKEMWLVSRKMYQQSGCLSYDLSLCSGQESKSLKLTKGQKQALMEWEKRLSKQAVAGKRLSRDEAEQIRHLMKGIQGVLLRHTKQ